MSMSEMKLFKYFDFIFSLNNCSGRLCYSDLNYVTAYRTDPKKIFD